MLEHKHLILRGTIASPRNSNQIEQSLTNIVELVKMKLLAPARVVYCYEPGNLGYTGDVLLTTSHMVWHDWTGDDGTSLLQFDLYSCAAFTPSDVATYLKENHGLTRHEWRLFDREYGIREVYFGGAI